MDRGKIKKIVLAGLLLAMKIVLSRFLSIRTPILTIGFGFIGTMLTARWLGLGYSIVLAALGDIIGATLFPTGTFFWGYTLSAITSGLIYGLIIYKNDKKKLVDTKAKRIGISAGIFSVLIGISLWADIRFPIYEILKMDNLGIPLFTVITGLTGLIYAAVVSKSKKQDRETLVKFGLAVAIVIVFVNSMMNTLWLYMTTQKALTLMLPVRIAKQLIMFPIQITLIYTIDKAFTKKVMEFLKG